MYSEFNVPDDNGKLLKMTGEGAIVGEGTAKRFGWKVGDRVPIKGAIYVGQLAIQYRWNLYRLAKSGRHFAILVSLRLFERKHRGCEFYKNAAGWYIVRLNNPDDAAT